MHLACTTPTPPQASLSLPLALHQTTLQDIKHGWEAYMRLRDSRVLNACACETGAFRLGASIACPGETDGM